MKNNSYIVLAILLFFFPLMACNEAAQQGQAEAEEEQEESTPISGFETDLPLEKIKLPAGFKISVYAKEVKNARSMVLSPSNTLFVGNRTSKNVYALRDEDGDGKAEKKYTIAEDMKMPNGVAFRDGSLYVAEVSRILRYDDIENKLASPPEPVVIYDKYPTETHHGWKYINFGPDGKLYVPVGAPCNICNEEDEVYASITRMNPDGSEVEVFASGVRNSVGFDWHPTTGELWFTDNGRDRLGDDVPPDELNHASQKGLHFGYPFCHAGEITDPEFGSERDCSEFTKPAQKLGPHVAALGMEFYEGKQFPSEYKNQIFIAEHGSWNRSSKIGYRIMLVKLEGNKVVSYEPFATGWLQGEDVWGRPVDVETMPDGSLLVSDDQANVIYRISYEG
ncbi:sorbosone dehydrogenase family protein [Flammeovirgaceae bacterium SG7u.111]|nr:sorbosone dehydrogenase family protein [Flammeovirgaceae bacterium SG7u.132]WPO36049.1 sorbosone dehydrogenase family protein [Flammeovirgaceae bacterium SG7u.111]